MGEDEDLAARAGRGDERAFELLVARWWERLGRFAAAATGGDRELAEEAAQDALYRLFAALPRFRGDSAFGTFAYGICRRAAVDALRRRVRERRGRAPGGAVESSAFSPYLGPEERLVRESEAEAMRRAMSRMPERARSLVYLKEVEGLRVAELARVFGMREGTVKSGLSRARDALRSLLEEDGYAVDR
jgi:RNA polymerase sigma-70 factor, ECF subfamily